MEIVKIGHRGAMGYEPENTLKSFEKAIELGVDMIELDVYVCKTGELVVMHDDRVDRTTNGKGYIFDKSFEELKELDAGEGEKVPTLQEVLDLVDKKVIVNIELRGGNNAGLVAKVVEEYVNEKGWSSEDFIISSFDHYELLEFGKLNSEVKIGALVTGIPIDYAEFAEKLNAYSVNLSIEFINKEFIEDAHNRGVKVFVWTVNHEDDIEKMKKLNVDGIYSNFPDRL